MAKRTTQDPEDLLYPDSDGKPIADSTLQFEWIVKLYENLSAQYYDDPNVLVVADLLWYAMHGQPTECTAPDTLVIFGRPKGHRGSYRQWREDGVAPQVVFEVLSPIGTTEEMDSKFAFYERHKVEEYYLYDPERAELFGWLRRGRRLKAIAPIDGWISPRLKIRFDLSGDKLVIFTTDGERFLTFVEKFEQVREAERDNEMAQRQLIRAKRQREKAEDVQRNTEAIQQKIERMKAELRKHGVDPDKLTDNDTKKNGQG